MAEIIDLNINIGANTTDFEGSLTKAQNLLKQFEAALKKATNVGEINYLNNSIKTLNAQITTLGNQMNRVGRPAGDATTALSNLSRVAQDAPYGFIGIANNLNPLLESFQRLQKETGSSKAALGAMVSGLTGPAGIGIALGVVSSLAIVFSKQITEAFKGPEEQLKQFREELNKVNADIYKLIGSVQATRTTGLSLVNIITGGNEKESKAALQRLKDLFKENKAIQDAKLGNDKTYYTNLVNLASVQKEAIAKEDNNSKSLELLYAKQKEIEDKRDKLLAKAKTKTTTQSAGSYGGTITVTTTAEEQRKKITAYYDKILNPLRVSIAKAEALNEQFVTAVSQFETPDPKKPSSPIVNYAREENKALNLELAKMKALREKMKSIGLEPLQLFELPSDTRAAEKKRKGYFQGKEKELLEESNQSGFGAFIQNKIKKDQADIKSDEARKKRLEDLNKKYSEIAQNVSQNVTGALFGMYDAMQEGVSAGEALGQMFSRLARSIAESLVQAALFAGILSLISGGAGAEGGVSFFGAFKSILGLAEGGVATGPTLAMIGEGSESEAVLPLSKLGNMMQTSFNAGSMNTNSMAQNGQFVLRGNDLVLALQRSNSSLNLRRGI